VERKDVQLANKDIKQRTRTECQAQNSQKEARNIPLIVHQKTRTRKTNPVFVIMFQERLTVFIILNMVHKICVICIVHSQCLIFTKWKGSEEKGKNI